MGTLASGGTAEFRGRGFEGLADDLLPALKDFAQHASEHGLALRVTEDGAHWGWTLLHYRHEMSGTVGAYYVDEDGEVWDGRSGLSVSVPSLVRLMFAYMATPSADARAHVEKVREVVAQAMQGEPPEIVL